MTIEALYFAEHERRQAFLYEQHCWKENERHEQIQHLRGQLRKILPKGGKRASPWSISGEGV